MVAYISPQGKTKESSPHHNYVCLYAYLCEYCIMGHYFMYNKHQGTEYVC